MNQSFTLFVKVIVNLFFNIFVPKNMNRSSILSIIDCSNKSFGLKTSEVVVFVPLILFNYLCFILKLVLHMKVMDPWTLKLVF